MVKRVMVMAAVEKETRDGYRLTSFDFLRFVLHDLPSKFIDRGEREMNLPFSFFPLYLQYLFPNLPSRSYLFRLLTSYPPLLCNH